MSARRLRLFTSSSTITSDDTQSLSEPPTYLSNALPPSYSSRHSSLAIPTGPRQLLSPCSSSSASTSADTGQTSSYSPSILDSEAYISDDTSQSYGESISAFPLNAPSTGGSGRGDVKGVPNGSFVEVGRALSDRDTASVFSTPPASTSGALELRYIYYQVYSEGEAVLSKTAFMEHDPYPGRIIAKRIAPPHTAYSIKRYLSKQEDIVDYNNTLLFSALSSSSPLEDHGHLSILTMDGPGYNLEEPMALVMSDPPKEPIPAPLHHSIATMPLYSTSVLTVDREPYPMYPMQLQQPVQAPPVPKGPTKEEIKQRKAEEKKQKKAEAKAKTERLALQLKESAKKRAEASAQERSLARSGRSNDRKPVEPTVFGALAGLY